MSLPCAAESLSLPEVKAGDSWTYRTTVEQGTSGWTQAKSELTVTRVSSTSIYYTSKQSGSNQAPVESFSGLDWSRRRNVNGKDTLISQPLSFPLTVGKIWQVQFTEQHPNKVHRSEQITSPYKVVGYKTVEVPAGKFNALKIECEGTWVAVMEPKQSVAQGAQTEQNSTTMVTQVNKIEAATITGRSYKA